MRFRRTCLHPRPRPPHRRRGGFTLIEASLAIIIVGLGVLAAAQLLEVGTKANADSHRLTSAVNLAGNIRELAQQRTPAQVLAMNGQTYSPPRDARDQAISGLDGWQQVISATRVNQDSITNQTTSTSSRLIRLSVSVRYRGREITQESWLLADTTDTSGSGGTGSGL